MRRQCAPLSATLTGGAGESTTVHAGALPVARAMRARCGPWAELSPSTPRRGVCSGAAERSQRVVSTSTCGQGCSFCVGCLPLARRPSWLTVTPRGDVPAAVFNATSSRLGFVLSPEWRGGWVLDRLIDDLGASHHVLRLGEGGSTDGPRWCRYRAAGLPRGFDKTLAFRFSES